MISLLKSFIIYKVKKGDAKLNFDVIILFLSSEKEDKSCYVIKYENFYFLSIC